MGIKEIQEIISLAKKMITVGESVLDDGKVSLADLPKLMPLWSAIQAAVEGANLALDEIKDLDAAEAKALAADAVEVVFALVKLMSKKPAA
jgi:hypothetical protein